MGGASRSLLVCSRTWGTRFFLGRVDVRLGGDFGDGVALGEAKFALDALQIRRCDLESIEQQRCALGVPFTGSHALNDFAERELHAQGVIEVGNGGDFALLTQDGVVVAVPLAAQRGRAAAHAVEVDLVALSDVDWQHENLLQVSLSSFLVSRIRPKRLLASYSTPLPRG